MGLVSVLVVLAGQLGWATVLIWDWPSEQAGNREECRVRTCGGASDGTTWANDGAPCSEPASGEKCVVAFEYHITGRMGHRTYCRGMVPVSRCGAHAIDVGDSVRDAFHGDGTPDEHARWQYMLRVRSIACDAMTSAWAETLFGDEPFCSDVEVGDVNADGVIDREDVIGLLLYLLFAGPAPPCFHAADVNQNGILGLFDAFEILLSLPGDA